MSVKVELGFTADGSGGPFLTLDDPVLGRLDDPNVVLGGGEVFADVSQYFQEFTLQRGKSRELDRYQAGQASVTFNNRNRVFDPTYTASPIFGQIVPRRKVRISVDSIVEYVGTIDDWNIDYEPGNNSRATLQAFDVTSYFVGVNAGTATYTDETTGTRLNNLLDAIGWSPDNRDIDPTGAVVLGTAIADGTPLLPIMQTIALSEPGDLFISKTGAVKLVGRNTSFTSSGAVFSDSGAGIPYKTIQAIYGSELLYNNVITSSSIGTATARNATSEGLYGQRTLVQETYLNSQQQLADLADLLVGQYSDPEFRFQGITVDLQAISSAQRATVLDIELGDVVKVEFTPSNIPPAIVRYGKVIGLGYSISPNRQEVFLQLQSKEGSLLVLDDPVFGKLDSGNILGW